MTKNGDDSATTLSFLKLSAHSSSGTHRVAPAITVAAIDALKDTLQLTDAQVLRLVGMTPRTYKRYQLRGGNLKAATTDAVLRAARILQDTHATFGDEAKALRWLKADHPILGARPLELLGSAAGSQSVVDELSRIRWGDLA